MYIVVHTESLQLLLAVNRSLVVEYAYSRYKSIDEGWEGIVPSKRLAWPTSYKFVRDKPQTLLCLDWFMIT